MMMKPVRSALVTALMMLSGCASVAVQQPLQFAQGSYVSGAQGNRIGVAMTALPKVDTHLPGADCLLCLAAAAAANSSLTGYTHTLPYEELPALKNDIADLLRKKGLDATVIDEALVIDTLPKNRAAGPNAAPRDFSSLKAKYNVDKLLVIDVTTLGFVRTYSAYIPTSDPIGTFRGTGYIIDLSNNAYEWYLPVAISKSAEGEWKEPPKYPGLTNAYFQALAIGRDEFLKPFTAQ